MVLNENLEPLFGSVGAVEALLQPPEYAGEYVLLNEIEKFLFALEIVIKPGKRHTCGTADIADGGAFKTAIGKDLRGVMKDVLKLGFGIAGNGETSRHNVHYRTFVRLTVARSGRLCQYLHRFAVSDFLRLSFSLVPIIFSSRRWRVSLARAGAAREPFDHPALWHRVWPTLRRAPRYGRSAPQ